MEDGVIRPEVVERFMTLARKTEIKDDMGNAMDRRQLYQRVAGEYMVPSYKSRATTIPYLKCVMLVPFCFKITNEEFQRFVEENGGRQRLDQVLELQLKHGVAQTLITVFTSDQFPARTNFCFEPGQLPDAHWTKCVRYYYDINDRLGLLSPVNNFAPVNRLADGLVFDQR